MADSTIPQLQEAAAEDVNDEFVLPVDSGTETYKLKFENLMAYLVANFPADWITEAMVKANAITSGKIANGAITTAKIGNSQVTGAKIASNTITAGNIAANAVGQSELASNAVINANVASNAGISPSKIGWTQGSGNPSYPIPGHYLYANRGSDVTGISNGYRRIMFLSVPAGLWLVTGTVTVNSGGTNIQRIVAAVSRNSDSVDGGANDGGLVTFLNRSAGAIPEQINIPVGIRLFGNSSTSDINLIAYTEGTAYANQFDSNCQMWAIKLN